MSWLQDTEHEKVLLKYKFNLTQQDFKLLLIKTKNNNIAVNIDPVLTKQITY